MPFDILSRTTGLADTAYAELTAFFATVGHRPQPPNGTPYATFSIT